MQGASGRGRFIRSAGPSTHLPKEVAVARRTAEEILAAKQQELDELVKKIEEKAKAKAEAEAAKAEKAKATAEERKAKRHQALVAERERLEQVIAKAGARILAIDEELAEE
jgi:septal ring factor EnvC (AmiA/AmiB activator)